MLVIGADVMSSIIDYTDRATCVIFGDGAGAVILEPAERTTVGMIDFMHEIDGSGGLSLNMPGGGSLNPSPTKPWIRRCTTFIRTARGLQVGGAQMAEACAKFFKRNGLTARTSKLIIPHQANLRIINATAERLRRFRRKRGGQHRPLRQHHRGATIPLAMHTAIEEGRLKKGGLVLACRGRRRLHGRERRYCAGHFKLLLCVVHAWLNRRSARDLVSTGDLAWRSRESNREEACRAPICRLRGASAPALPSAVLS